MEFDAVPGFHFHSLQGNVQFVECSHCGEHVFDKSIDTFPTVKRIVDFFVAHLGMFHPEEMPPAMIE